MQIYCTPYLHIPNTCTGGIDGNVGVIVKVFGSRQKQGLFLTNNEFTCLTIPLPHTLPGGFCDSTHI